MLKPVLDRIDADLDGALARLAEFLRIPSVSADPRHRADILRAAEWAAAQLRGVGFTARVVDTPGHPMVVGRCDGPAGAPHFLYYGHYDVQPADPLAEWTSPPFEPVIVDGPRGRRIVARGAVDDKGQVMTFIEAFRAWRAVHGSLPIGATVFLEGEEEVGSPSLTGFLKAHRDELAAEACVVCDTSMWDVRTPAITCSLRGLAYFELSLQGPSCDLHSGAYGGAVRNPILHLARILGELHDANGRVQIPGFYDDVRAVEPAQLAQWAALGFDEGVFLSDIGLSTPAGEKGRTALERLWARPTCDANGISGGYTGVGAKTVIPARVTVKLSCRLVPDQDPKKVRAGLESFLNARTPPDFKWGVQAFSLDPAVRVPTDSPWLAATRRALARVFDREPVLIGSGGSIPVVGHVRSILGQDSLLVGFGLEDDRVHSPNEKFEVACFHNGMRAHASMLDAFAATAHR